MKIEKKMYKVVCRGKRFPLPLYVNESFVIREKVLIQKRIENPESFIRSIRPPERGVSARADINSPARTTDIVQSGR